MKNQNTLLILFVFWEIHYYFGGQSPGSLVGHLLKSLTGVSEMIGLKEEFGYICQQSLAVFQSTKQRLCQPEKFQVTHTVVLSVNLYDPV